MRYRLRTLLILLAVGPLLLAGAWWSLEAWQAEQARQRALEAEEAEKARIAELIELTTWQARVSARLPEPSFEPAESPATRLRIDR